jgi:hypothetical protein
MLLHAVPDANDESILALLRRCWQTVGALAKCAMSA